MKRLIAFALVVGAGIVVACGDDDAAPGGTTPGGSDDAGTSGTPNGDAAPAVAAVDAFNTAYCAFQERCRQGTFHPLYADQAACVAEGKPILALNVGRPGTGYTEAALQSCAAKLPTIECAVQLDSTPECTFTGSLADGKPCYLDSQCANGACAYHRAKLTDPAPTCGVCAPRAQLGGSCVDVICAPGGYADRTGATADTDKCTCIKLPKEGESCTDSCDGFAACRGGTCKLLHESGAECIDDEDCDLRFDLVCRDHKCTTLPRVAVGGTCSDTVDCTAGTCSGGTCKALGQPGEACGPNTECRYDLQCVSADGGTGACIAYAANTCR